MAPRRAETSRQTEAVNIVPPIQIQKVTAPPIINSNPTPTVNSNVLNGNNNNDIKALLSTTVQCFIQLLNAMNTTPNLANNFDTVNSAQADANQINFYYPYTINSLHELSSDHNPVMLNFTLKLNKDITNPRAVHTNWPLFSKYLNTKLSLLNYHPNSINSNSDIDQKISEFTDTVRPAHSHASRPIETLRKSFTPHHIHKLIKQKNQFRNLYHRTLDPHYKTLYNRAKKNVKKELKNYTNENWTARLQALSTQDNSLWAVQKFHKNKRSDIPSLHCNTGTAITDKQKANILAESILTNFTENERHNNEFDEEDEIVNNTLRAFLSHPPPPTAETAYPSEIISYIKSSNAKKVPAVMRPILAYGCPVWGYAAKTNINILDTLQNSTIRMIGYENKIDRERQRAGASAQNEWQRGTEANMRKKPKIGEGRDNKRRQSQSGRDVGGAKHETGRNGQNDKRHGRERTEAGAAKEGNKESEQNKLVWFTVHECMRNRLKLLEERGRRELATGV
ncbi:putative RNA-directed DNA polymerase from transposon X-element [Trichonephila clavipes]|nr:putative RNA-directed DNA polymerase from transposon X-element [Trichonephila clavipes]